MTLDPGTLAPLAVTLQALTDPDFWVSVGVLAGIYAIVALGLQLNTGFTGIVNFGMAAFMAIGAYAMAILVLKAGFSFWLALPCATLASMPSGVLVGLLPAPARRLLRDRHDRDGRGRSIVRAERPGPDRREPGPVLRSR
jgi:branched-chain amino acid transport system permease protein